MKGTGTAQEGCLAKAERDAKLHSKLDPVDPLKKALVALEDLAEGWWLRFPDVSCSNRT